MIGLVRSILPTILVYAALVGWGYASWQVLQQAPSGKLTTSLTINASQTPTVLGARELGQRVSSPRSAARQHLLVARRNGAWLFGNRTNSKRVLLTTDKLSERYIQRWEIRKGDRISFNGADIVVDEADNDRLVLRERGSGRKLVWDGAMVPTGEPVHKVCTGIISRNVAWAKWVSRTWFGTNKPEVDLFSIGGGVNCSNRWKMPKLPPHAAYITWQGGKFWVAPGARGTSMLLYRVGQARGTAFVDLTAPLNGPFGRVRSLIAGQTRYRVRASGDRLILTPIANRDFFYFDEPAPPDYESVSWIGAGRSAGAWVTANILSVGVGVLAAMALAAGAVLLWFRRKDRSLWNLLHALGAVIPAVTGIWLTLLLVRKVGDPDMSLVVAMAWLSWFWASFMLVWSGRMQSFAGWTWLAGTILAGIGTTVLFQLGAGADNTRWLGFYYKDAAIISLFGWAIAILSVVPDRNWLKFWLFIFNRERVVFAVAGVLIAAMVLQFFVGSEEGIAGLQPVELVKTVFVILLGFVGLHVTETRRREARAYRRSPIRFLMPYFRFAAIFFLFIGGMVVGVRDFSPMVIMTVVLTAWLWKLGGSQGEFYKGLSVWRFVRPLILLGVVGFIAGMTWVYHNPEKVPDGFPQKDRILVWAQPELHPHSGTQVLDSMDLVGRGGWLGAKPWFGRNDGVMKLAAVQDDFITAFLINRFGGYAGLAMLATQLFYVLLLFTLGKVLERQFGEGDFREQNAGIVLGFTLYGLAWMMIAHWLISWGNTLGLLPVMGQPMTWLTAGNSHLIAFALLILFIALVSGWISLGYSEEEREAKRKRGMVWPSRQKPKKPAPPQKVEPRLA